MSGDQEEECSAGCSAQPEHHAVPEKEEALKD